MKKQVSEKLPRIEVVDALRGFAVMAILLVHSLEHFIFPVYPTAQPGWLGYTLSLLVGSVLFLLQLQFCKWWLKGHKQGPLESIWHKWTWM